MSRRYSRRRSSPPPLDDLDLLSDNLFGPSERPSHARRDPARALGALCREAERTITIALGAAADPCLRDLSVVGVVPAPDATRLEVVVAPSACPSGDLVALHAALDRSRGALRAELARALQRKRTPDLRFRLDLSDGSTGASHEDEEGGGE